MAQKKQPTFVDLFAGCGGLSLGLELAGFQPLFVNELNNHAMQTYLLNRQEYPLLGQKYNIPDVKKMVLDEGFMPDLVSGFNTDYGVDVKKGELDLLVGGPPCQGFSGIGHRRSYSVDKKQIPSNHLYEDMAYVVHKLQPKIFLFENVGGLLSAKWSKDGGKGEIWEDVKAKLSQIPGYTIGHSLVRAKEYGVPQNRPRVLLVGVRNDIGVGATDSADKGYLPGKTMGYPSLKELLGDLIDPDYENGGKTLYYPESAKTPIQRFLRLDHVTNKIKPKGAFVSEHEYSNHKPDVVSKFTYMLKHNGEIHESMKTKKFSQRLLPAVWGPEGPSITATSLPDDYVHFSQPRTLSVREWARLQTFPDWYEFAGKRTTGGLRRAGNPREGLFDREVPKYTQIGNAVPVLLAKALGQHFLEMLGYKANIEDSEQDAA